MGLPHRHSTLERSGRIRYREVALTVGPAYSRYGLLVILYPAKGVLMTERKIITSLAISADGYIARPDGGVDWLDRPRTAGDYGMRDFYNSIDTILLGRKTYEVALGFGKKGSAFSKKTRNYVFTHTPPTTTDFPVEF